MTASAVYGQPAFILKYKKYRETSLILDILSRDFGRFSLLAKGVKKTKSKTAAILQPFIPLNLSYVGHGELKTLTHAESVQAGVELQGLALYCGYYISELVLNLLHPHDPNPDVFNSYMSCLSTLATATGLEMEAALRIFEMDLIEKIGYGLQFETDFISGQPVVPTQKYAFDVENGPFQHDAGTVSGTTLLAMHSGQMHGRQTLNEAKFLMRSVIDTHLQGRPLKSRQVINQVISRIHNEQ